MSGDNRFRLVCLVGVVAAFMATALPAKADNVDITYSAATQTAPDFSAICAGATTCDYGMENFSSWTGSSVFDSTFKDAGTGTYSQPTGVTFSGVYTAGSGTTTGTGGEWIKQAQNEYGGVNGQAYPELYGPSASQVTNVGTADPSAYNLALTSTGVPGINYFGIWISALDAYNNLTIYDGSTVVAQFNSQVLLTQLGSCSGSNAYCGNPTSQFLGQDSGELFVYVNVFDLNGYITSVSFTDASGTGFESDNDAVAYVTPIHPVGNFVPEPSTFTVFGVALAALFKLRRRG